MLRLSKQNKCYTEHQAVHQCPHRETAVIQKDYIIYFIVT